MRPNEMTVQEPQETEGLSMLDAMKLGVDQALLDHLSQSVPIITWDAETRQIVEVPPDQIPAWISAQAANPPS